MPELRVNPVHATYAAGLGPRPSEHLCHTEVGLCSGRRLSCPKPTLDPVHRRMTLRRLLPLFAIAVLCFMPPPPCGAEDGPTAKPLPKPPLSPEQELAKKRKKQQEFEQRKVDLPKTAKRTLALIERFEKRELRLWAVSRQKVIEQGPDAVPALVLMLESEDWEVRAFSASCLEALQAADAMRPLLTALQNETYIEARRRMVMALGTLNDAGTEPALLTASQDQDEGVVLAAIRALGALKRKESMPALRAFVKHKNLDIRYEALSILASLDDEKARAKLHKKAQAQVATSDLRRYDSVRPFDMSDRYEQYLIGVALARANDEEADKLLRKILRADKPWHKKIFLRLGAAEGLGRRAAEGLPLHKELIKGLSHDDNPVRVACSYGLSFVGAGDHLRALKRALSDKQLDVRVNVVKAVGHINTPEAVKALRKSVKDRSPDVRAATARALSEMTVPEAADALITMLKDKKYVNRVLAARGLASRTDVEDVVSALTKASKDPDYGVRAQALASLSRAVTKSDEALKILVGAMTDRDYGVQVNAYLGINALLDVLDEQPELDEPILKRIVTTATEARIDRLRLAADELLDGQRPPGAIPFLIQVLGADEERKRRRANSLLSRMTEKNMNFDSKASPRDRKDAAARWKAWWEGSSRTLPKRGRRSGAVVTGSLAEQTRDLKWRGMDIVLLLDSTGSMAGLLRSTKQSIDQIIAGLASPLPSLRISLFTYRDVGDNYVYYGTPLTYDIEHLPGFLQSFVHGQGGDIPEAVFDSVNAAMRELKWRKDAHKVIIFAGDAPHHPEQDKDFKKAIKKWATKENRAVMHAIFTDTNRRSLDINRRTKREDPDDFQHPYLDIYREVSGLGRGRAVLLSDESALIKEILVLAFGPTWRADIENFLDFQR